MQAFVERAAEQTLRDLGSAANCQLYARFLTAI